NPSDIQALKFRVGALRGLVDDLKKLADEIDPPPTPEAEFKKLIDEYDALVLRLVKTPVGRLLVTTKPQEWKPGELTVSGLTPDEQNLVIRLLRLRDEVVAQKEKFE